MIENLLQTLTNDRTSPFKWHHPATFELLLAGGIHWNMVRYFKLDVPAKIKVGLVAQCPGGEGADLDFYSFQLEHHSVKDIRAGI